MTTFSTDIKPNGILAIEGPDSIKFLQGQTTCNLDDLSETNALYGAFCNPKGRIKSTFMLIQINPQKILMLLDKSQCGYLQDELKIYIAFFKADITDVTETFHIVGLLTQEEGIKESVYSVSSADGNIRVILPGNTRREIILSEVSSQSTFDLPHDNESASLSQWAIQDIQNGLVWTEEQTREKFLPHDINLPGLGGVSYEKGCYTGQEIIARMHYRGNPKYTTAVITSEETPEQLDATLKVKLADGKTKSVGHVITKHITVERKTWILASVHKDLLDEREISLSIAEERTILCQINRTIL